MTMDIEIAFGQGHLFPVFDRLFMNGEPYSLIGGTGHVYHFAGPSPGPIRYVSFSANDGPRASRHLPLQMLVNGRLFVRRCEDFYIADGATSTDVAFFFDAIADTYEHTIETEVNRTVIRKMLLGALHHGARMGVKAVDVLDYGCGTGLAWSVLDALDRKIVSTGSSVRLLGCDISEGMLGVARSHGYGGVVHCDDNGIPLGTHSFHVIIAAFVVHYFGGPAPFKEMARLLRPGGLLLFNLPRYDRRHAGQMRLALKECLGKDWDVRQAIWRVRTRQDRRFAVIRAKAPTVTTQETLREDNASRLPFTEDTDGDMVAVAAHDE